MGYELQTLERALELLSSLATNYPQRLVDLTEGLNTNQTTTLRTLRVLERHGYVRRGRNGLDYYLGARLSELGHAATAGIDVLEAVAPWAMSLSRECHMTVHVGMLRDGAITVIAKHDAPESRVRYSALGTRMPLHATAAGKAALALRAPSRAELAELTLPLTEYTPHSIRDLTTLEQALADTVTRGYSLEIEEYNVGFGCIGTAFQISDDIYTVSISGLATTETDMQRIGERLRSAIDEFLQQYSGAITGLDHHQTSSDTPVEG